MEKNVGSVDRAIRVVAGIIVGLLGIIYGSWWGLIGLVLIGTGVFNRCLLYMPFGINTCATSPAEAEEPADPGESSE